MNRVFSACSEFIDMEQAVGEGRMCAKAYSAFIEQFYFIRNEDRRRNVHRPWFDVPVIVIQRVPQSHA